MPSADLITSFTVFCFIMAASPGPNNMMVLASGVRVGARRSMPLVMGIAFGMAVLLSALGFGLGAIFEAFPVTKMVMRALSALFLIWLAWKLATAGPLKPAGSEAELLGFRTGVLFQWINPKAWAVTLSATATYLPPGGGPAIIFGGAAILAFAALASVTVWVLFGSYLSRFLQAPSRAHVFNAVMAALLLVSTLPILFGTLSI